MIDAEVEYDVREYLVGHRFTRGITGQSYDKLGPKARFKKWIKNVLTI